MVKVRVLHHSIAENSRERICDIHKVRRNPDKLLHPFEKPREIVSALNAVKLNRLFAKPFICSLDGHADGIYTLSKHYRDVNIMLSGSADKCIRLWDLGLQRSIFTISNAHNRFVKGVTFVQNEIDHEDMKFLSCSDDKTIKLWSTGEKHREFKEPYCVKTYSRKNAFTAIDHHYTESLFASSGKYIGIWNLTRSKPTMKFKLSDDTFTNVKFNIAERNILAASSHDRGVSIYDIRLNSPLTKTILAMKPNNMSWNPMEPFNFTVANEDHCCYTFDMRRMSHASNIFRGHVSAVMDVDYSPTGQEIVTGAYDKSIRIFDVKSDGYSRDTYYTKRMQRVFAVKFTMDSNYIVSGSEDACLRLWRADSSHRFGYKNRRQEETIRYSKSLINKYNEIPEVKRIYTSRRLPREIVSQQKIRKDMIQAKKRRDHNIEKHSGNKVKSNPKEDIVVRVDN